MGEMIPDLVIIIKWVWFLLVLSESPKFSWDGLILMYFWSDFNKIWSDLTIGGTVNGLFSMILQTINTF